MKWLLSFVKAHKHIIALKLAVATMLIMSHYFPNKEFSTLVNLVWLILF